MPLPPWFEARLVRVRAMTPTVRELTFHRLDAQPMTFEPGQWLNVRLPIVGADGLPMKRAYSIASSPDGSPNFEIAVTRVEGGAGSTWLHETHVGTVLSFEGAQGFFTRPLATAQSSLFVATGTGITPLRSMVQAALAAGSDARLWVVLGVRHESDILYAEEFRAACETLPFVRFEPTLSRPEAPWTGRRGYVQTHVRPLWDELAAAGGGAKPHAYVCGLQRMVGAVRELLRNEMGVPREQVHSERYD